MFAQPIHPPNGYASLNSSIVVSTPYSHQRTHSQSRIPPSPAQQQTTRRTPSQKKLSLTCQNQTYAIPKQPKDSESGLKKRGVDFSSNRTYFTSIQNSRVKQNESITPSFQVPNSSLVTLKSQFQQKLVCLNNTYNESLNEYSQQIRELQIKLLNNSRLLEVKDKKINELENICSEYQRKMKTIPSNNTIEHLSTKVNDLQNRFKIIAEHYNCITQENYKKLEYLTQNILSSFNNKLQTLKAKSSLYAKASLTKIAQLEAEIDRLRTTQEKHSQGTRQSIESAGQIPQNRNIQSGNVSFWDDCFFYPSEHSQDFELIIEMTRRRQLPLSCWIDNQNYLRYTDTNSYLYNRKGDRIKLTPDQLNQLISQKLMIIV